MKRAALPLALLLVFSLLLGGCFGQKTPEDIVDDLAVRWTKWGATNHKQF